jgi:uncharacterized protein (DUF488 family)
MSAQPKTVFTIGHSNHPIDRFIALLAAHGVEALADVRRIPASRYNPQFNQNMLARALREARISYHHMVSLGGRRERAEAGLAGYSDYVKTEQFQGALAPLEELADEAASPSFAPKPCRRAATAGSSQTRWNNTASPSPIF